jgi:hypothetical protein
MGLKPKYWENLSLSFPLGFKPKKIDVKKPRKIKMGIIYLSYKLIVFGS